MLGNNNSVVSRITEQRYGLLAKNTDLATKLGASILLIALGISFGSSPK